MNWLDKRTVNKSPQQALCRTYATSSRLHFSYLFDLVWSSYSCPLVHALCKKICFLFSFLTIYLPPPSCLPACLLAPLPSQSSLSLASPSPPSSFFSPLSSLALHPAFTHFALLEELVCVCENLSEISLFSWIDCQRGQWRHCQQPGHEKCIA